MYFQTWFSRKWNFLCNFIIPHFRIISSHRISMTSFVSWISTYNSSKVTSSQLEFRNFRNWNGIWYDFRKNFKRIAEKNVVFFSFERFCIYLVVQLSPIPLHFPLDCTVHRIGKLLRLNTMLKCNSTSR